MINSIPKSLQNSLISSLTSKFGKDVILQNFKFSSGGCINNTGILETNVGKYFIKWNSRSSYPEMFEIEKAGLKLLNSANHSLKIPQAIISGSNEDYIFLVLENIITSPKNERFWENLGVGLAELHQNKQNNYGLEYDNYIGSLTQKNSISENWLKFFRQNRIEYTFRMASDSGFFNEKDREDIERILKYLDDNCPKNMEASLIHGDLWSGNLIVDEKGGPCLIDPAVYFGFREIEIAFTELFGAYDSRFYSAYNEAWPLDEGYEERKDIWNLYPLLVHVNLFGSSYASSVKSILRSFR